MTILNFRSITTLAATIAAIIVAALVGGCGIPQDGRYQTHDGGRSNNRAEAPAVPAISLPS